MTTKVADLSVDELRVLIKDVVTQTVVELLRDPDRDLELREDFAELLTASVNAVESGEETISVEDVADKLGLSW